MALTSAFFSSFLSSHYEHPILHASLDLIHLGIPWQPESPEELLATPIHAVPLLILLLLLFAPLPAYLENSSPFHFDLHLFILYAWKDSVALSSSLCSSLVEDAIVLAFAQCRCPNLARQCILDPKSSGDPKFMEVYGNTDLLIAVMLYLYWKC
ncbi:hypothetical protein LOK49_LG05G01228 [Camellia lanceoleosa]|uniref:Uncharacterized protein n=1 Tax=Camellia lanceoleosa TaxID=1840588 RepID=A0ACC0HUI3_9ERIC|nr:hypothetical protein LOK49_LG05G01228 [Camellia lanceoleosa]